MSEKWVVDTIQERRRVITCDTEECAADSETRCSICLKDFCFVHGASGQYSSQFSMGGNWICGSCWVKGKEARHQINKANEERTEKADAARAAWRARCVD